MAIIKEKTVRNGAVGNYWRILNISIDRQSFKATAQLGLFKDSAASDANLPHLGLVKTFNFNFTVLELVSASNVIAYIYTRIMATANSMVTRDLLGNELEEPVPFDSDIAGGTFG